jgi:acyl-CoA thioester hydrolase
MPRSAPPWESIVGLPVRHAGRVHSAQLDHNGHLTVTEYFTLLTAATTSACGDFGLSLWYPVERGMGLFGVDHHARYLHELRLGDSYGAYVRLLDATDMGVHTMAYLLDMTRPRVTATLETVLLNVDLESRRACSFASDTKGLLYDGLLQADGLNWEATVCGSMGLPGRSLGPVAVHSSSGRRHRGESSDERC